MSNKSTVKAKGVNAKTAPNAALAAEQRASTGGVSTAVMPAVKQLEEGGFVSVSAKIRELSRLGFTKGAIAKHLDKRYQHVYNVLKKPLAVATSEGGEPNTTAE